MSNINYIDKQDYTISISVTNLEDIIAQGIESTGLTEEQLLDNSELTAQAEIRSYLNSVYQIDVEFAKNYDDLPDERNKLTLRCVVNLSLFNLHMTINPRDVPEKVENAYDRCMQSLDAAQRGELDLGLIPNDETTDPSLVNWRTIGSNFKFTSKPFADTSNLEE